MTNNLYHIATGAVVTRYDDGTGIDTLRMSGPSRTPFIDLSYNGNDFVAIATAFFLGPGLNVTTGQIEVKIRVGKLELRNGPIENAYGSNLGEPIDGNRFANSIFGADGDDTITGKAGNDILDGGAGSDSLNGEGGNDVLYTDANDWRVLGGAGFDHAIVLGAAGMFIGLASAGIERVTGGTGGDVFDARGAPHALNLAGGGGNDQLFGGLGVDTLTGGLGRDVMTGGANRDIFDFNAAGESGKTSATRDVIRDFNHGQGDDIDLSTIDAATGPGNQKFAFIGQGAFTGVKGQLHYRFEGPAKTIVEGDINGDKKADFQIELTGHKLLVQGDFIL